MISPWHIYRVMQMDNIIGVAFGLSAIGLICLPLVWVYVVDNSLGLIGRVVASAVSVIWVLILAAAVFLPSSKTAAAMLIIPAIANNERIQAEAGDLYALAKQGLQKLVTDDTADQPAAEGQ